MAASHQARVQLRPLGREDLETLQRWDEDEEIIRASGKKFSRLRAEEWLLTYRHGRAMAFAVTDATGRLIGDVELEDINWRRREAELRICLGEKTLWNRGYGTEAVRLVLRHAFYDLGLRYIFLRVYVTNARAVRCYEKCGFRPVGVLRADCRHPEWEDILLMAVTPQQFERVERVA